MRNLVILGSTGSIGSQTLEVVEELEEEFSVLAVTANNNIDLLAKQARKFNCRYAVLMNESRVDKLKYKLNDTKTKVLSGEEGLLKVASLTEADLVVNSVVGAAGIKPTLEAIKSGNTVGLANKESLVAAGSIITNKAAEKNVSILPIDSEHNAIFQVLQGEKRKNVNKIILTASGGPFRKATGQDLEQVTVEDALDHPNWDMGGKITIDSATLMNKGLEVIEAHWLFNIKYDKIEVVVHPQSVVHSLVEFNDHSLQAELGLPDMKVPIQYALTYPERQSNQLESLSLAEMGKLTFEPPNLNLFPCLKLAYKAGKLGGTMPAVLNAANEVAVEKFLAGELNFVSIPQIVREVMEAHTLVVEPTLSEILEKDKWARTEAEKVGDRIC